MKSACLSDRQRPTHLVRRELSLAKIDVVSHCAVAVSEHHLVPVEREGTAELCGGLGILQCKRADRPDTRPISETFPKFFTLSDLSSGVLGFHPFTIFMHFFHF
jgi:hypothetical protein